MTPDTGAVGHDLPGVPSGFEVERLLGHGGSAVVWLARHTATGEAVALKVWRRPLADDHERRRFSNECRRHRQLSGHPNIVDWFWASGPDEGNPWTATRPHGTSLAEYLAEHGSPDLAVALDLSLDLLDGLAAMHRRGLIHRDIKPGNVLIHEGRAALCDLGIAMPVEEVTREYRAGTSGYLAPELDGRGDPGQQPDRRSDVYSAALTISRMIGDDAPHDVDHLVHARAGSSRREDRPHDAAEFGRQLRAAIRASSIATGSAAGRRRPRSPERHHRGRAAALSAVAALAIAGAGFAGAAITRGDSAGSASALGPSVTHPPTNRGTAGGTATAAGTPPIGAGASPTAGTPRATIPATPAAGTSAALGALAAAPDIGPGMQPVLRGVRAPGECAGQPLPGGTQVHRVGGRALAVTRVYADGRGRVCAMLEKASDGGLYNQKSYLALSLCNALGQCDHDWNEYRVNAGPVAVGSPDACVTWRVSAMDAAGRRWLIADQFGAAPCPGSR